MNVKDPGADPGAFRIFEPTRCQAEWSCYVSNRTPPAPRQVRHHCRNPRCRARLSVPVENRTQAFCVLGCYEAFFRRRCVVCERSCTDRQRTCGKKCKAEARRFPQIYAPPRQSPRRRSADAKSARQMGLKTRPTDGRGWRIVAGSELSPTAFRLATIPLDADFTARLARVHAPLEEHRRKVKRAGGRKAQVKRRDPPLNLLGGYRFPNAPTVDLSPINPPAEWGGILSRWAPCADPDPSAFEDIPDFLNRIPAAPRPAAADEAELMPEPGLAFVA